MCNENPKVVYFCGIWYHKTLWKRRFTWSREKSKPVDVPVIFKITCLITPELICTIEFVFLPQKLHFSRFDLISCLRGLFGRGLLQRLFWSKETLPIKRMSMNMISEPSEKYPEVIQSKFEAWRQRFSSRVHGLFLKTTSPSKWRQ